VFLPLVFNRLADVMAARVDGLMPAKPLIRVLACALDTILCKPSLAMPDVPVVGQFVQD